MEKRIRVLGIAPYEAMNILMSSLAVEYPQIELTQFVGDREKGLEIARENFHGNYDVIISRGGTAQMLRESIDLPVIEIGISTYDLLCTLRLAGGANDHIAIVSASNVIQNAKMLRSLVDCKMDFYTYDSAETAEAVLAGIPKDAYDALLCDMIANTTACRLGMNSFLITSSADSIRYTFDQVLLLCRSQERLREENQFLRELLQWQIGHTVIFNQDGSVYLSTISLPEQALLDMLRNELPECLQEPERRITRNLNGMLHSIRARQITSGQQIRIAFFFVTRKSPLTSGQMGIKFSTRPESEHRYYGSILSLTGFQRDHQTEIEHIGHSTSPVMITGEDGTGKEFSVDLLYMRSALRHAPLVTVNCPLLNEKSWNFLLEHCNSPLADEGSSIYFMSIDALPEAHRKQLLAALTEMNVCQRNRVFFSCVCQPGESMSPIGSEFMDALNCLSLYLPPLRQIASHIPTLVNLYLNRLNENESEWIVGVEPEAMALLQNYGWPHNCTQFCRVINELTVLSPGRLITGESVRQALHKERYTGSFTPRAENDAAPLNLNRTLSEINQDIALRVVAEHHGNQTLAAKHLGISRTTLWRMTQKHH